MADAAVKLMTAEEFLLWDLEQDVRHELVDGVPVAMVDSITMMSGASGMHDQLVVNAITLLNTMLRGSRCRVATADTAVRTKIHGFRRPDVSVTCDPPRGDVYEAREPRLVVEVLSPSNEGLRWERKLAEYRRHEGLQYILLVESRYLAATLYTRTASGWEDQNFDAPADVIALPAIGCTIPMSDLYADTGLEPLPPGSEAPAM